MGIKLVNREKNTRVNERTNPELLYPLMEAKIELLGGHKENRSEIIRKVRNGCHLSASGQFLAEAGREPAGRMS